MLSPLVDIGVLAAALSDVQSEDKQKCTFAILSTGDLHATGLQIQSKFNRLVVHFDFRSRDRSARVQCIHTATSEALLARRL